MTDKTNSGQPSVTLHTDNDCLAICFAGNFQQYDGSAVLTQIRSAVKKNPQCLYFRATNLGAWDSSLLLIIFDAVKQAKLQNIKTELENLPQNIQDLIRLAFEVDRSPTKSNSDDLNFIENIGYKAIGLCKLSAKVLHFCAQAFGAVGRLFTGNTIMRSSDFLAALEDCGPKALGIVSLISFLVGLILAFVGGVQLQEFGAQIYIASLVTIGMCRIMGAIMVGIIMAGRTGSSYAAAIGTMQVNEELDALETMGLSRIDFLVLPRLLALFIAMPILTMLSDFMGMVGGAFVGVVLIGLPYQEYWKYAFNAFHLGNFLVGLFHSLCFGVIIALCGCYQGINCGRNSDSVGLATTRSVVCAIVWMIVATGIITVICQELDI